MDRQQFESELLTASEHVDAQEMWEAYDFAIRQSPYGKPVLFNILEEIAEFLEEFHKYETLVNYVENESLMSYDVGLLEETTDLILSHVCLQQIVPGIDSFDTLMKKRDVLPVSYIQAINPTADITITLTKCMQLISKCARSKHNVPRKQPKQTVEELNLCVVHAYNILTEYFRNQRPDINEIAIKKALNIKTKRQLHNNEAGTYDSFVEVVQNQMKWRK